MIYLYKEYNVAYNLISLFLLIGFAVLALKFHMGIFTYLLLLIVVMILVFVVAGIFTRLTITRIEREVVIHYNECRANQYLDEIKRLFGDKKLSRAVSTIYNSYLVRGYAVLDDFDSVYSCCQNITTKGYKGEYHKYMLQYYIKKDQLNLVMDEMDQLKLLIMQLKNKSYINSLETYIKDAEYVIKIKNSDFEGAEEFYTGIINKSSPLYPITKVSCSYAIGRLLMLKGETERAKEYLQVAYAEGGDTKFKSLAEKLLKGEIEVAML